MSLQGKQVLKPLSMPKFNPVWKDVEGDWCKNESLASVPFSPLEARIAKEKPGLSQGLEKLRSLLGEEGFKKHTERQHASGGCRRLPAALPFGEGMHPQPEGSLWRLQGPYCGVRHRGQIKQG